jgi:hypothetical protein
MMYLLPVVQLGFDSNNDGSCLMPHSLQLPTIGSTVYPRVKITLTYGKAHVLWC